MSTAWSSASSATGLWSGARRSPRSPRLVSLHAGACRRGRSRSSRVPLTAGAAVGSCPQQRGGAALPRHPGPDRRHRRRAPLGRRGAGRRGRASPPWHGGCSSAVRLRQLAAGWSPGWPPGSGSGCSGTFTRRTLAPLGCRRLLPQRPGPDQAAARPVGPAHLRPRPGGPRRRSCSPGRRELVVRRAVVVTSAAPVGRTSRRCGSPTARMPVRHSTHADAAPATGAGRPGAQRCETSWIALPLVAEPKRGRRRARRLRRPPGQARARPRDGPGSEPRRSGSTPPCCSPSVRASRHQRGAPPPRPRGARRRRPGRGLAGLPGRQHRRHGADRTQAGADRHSCARR